eukprot:Pgem_evm1s17573
MFTSLEMKGIFAYSSFSYSIFYYPDAIQNLFHTIQEEFLNAEIKIDDPKSMYSQQGQRGGTRHN